MSGWVGGVCWVGCGVGSLVGRSVGGWVGGWVDGWAGCAGLGWVVVAFLSFGWFGSQNGGALCVVGVLLLVLLQ